MEAIVTFIGSIIGMFIVCTIPCGVGAYSKKKSGLYIGIIVCIIMVFYTMVGMNKDADAENFSIVFEHPIASNSGYLVGMILCIVFSVYLYHENEIRLQEIALLDSRIYNYINCFGFKSVAAFKLYCSQAPEFEVSRSIKYDNPDYERIKKINKSRAADNKIKVDSMIDFASFAVFKYKEIIENCYISTLKPILSQIYLLDFDIICKRSEAFNEFCNMDDGSFNKSILQHLVRCVISSMLNDKIIKVKCNFNTINEIYESTVISENEGNIRIGETITI